MHQSPTRQLHQSILTRPQAGQHAVLLGCLTEEHAISKVNTDRVRVKAMTEEELEDLVRYEQLVLSGTRIVPEPVSSTALVTELK